MNELEENHHAGRDWDRAMAQLRHEMAGRAVHPAHTVVLLPYVQLIGIARQAWLRHADAQATDALFVPRFETTMNWSRSLAGFAPGADDLQMDAARDLVTAASMRDRAAIRAQEQGLDGALLQDDALAAYAASTTYCPASRHWHRRPSAGWCWPTCAPCWRRRCRWPEAGSSRPADSLVHSTRLTSS